MLWQHAGGADRRQLPGASCCITAHMLHSMVVSGNSTACQDKVRRHDKAAAGAAVVVCHVFQMPHVSIKVSKYA